MRPAIDLSTEQLKSRFSVAWNRILECAKELDYRGLDVILDRDNGSQAYIIQFIMHGCAEIKEEEHHVKN